MRWIRSYLRVTDKSKLDAQPELFIRIVPDKINKTLSIIDSGVGMTKAGKIKILELCDMYIYFCSFQFQILLLSCL